MYTLIYINGDGTRKKRQVTKNLSCHTNVCLDLIPKWCTTCREFCVGAQGSLAALRSLKRMAQDQRQGELKRLFQSPGSRECGQNKSRSRAAQEESDYKRDILEVGCPGLVTDWIWWEEVGNTRHDSIKLTRIVLCPGQRPLGPSSGSVGAMRSFPVSVIQNEAWSVTCVPSVMSTGRVGAGGSVTKNVLPKLFSHKSWKS